MSRADISRCRLYGILDLSYVDRSNIRSVAEKMITGGVDLIQLRAKSHPVAEIIKMAADLHAITSGESVPLIVNDYPEVARAVPLAGVHLGQDDLSVADARKIIGRECVVGKSTHSVTQAIRAAEEGADYIGFGPLFATPTKPDYAPIGLREILRVHEKVSIPIFCIGGVKLENLADVIAARARRVVIVSGLLLAPDIAEYARACKAMLRRKIPLGGGADLGEFQREAPDE